MLWYRFFINSLCDDYRKHCRNICQSVFTCTLACARFSGTGNGTSYPLFSPMDVGDQYRVISCRIIDWGYYGLRKKQEAVPSFADSLLLLLFFQRSEERRVGKECRSGGATDAGEQHSGATQAAW